MNRTLFAWVGFVAARLASKKRGIPVLSVLGISVGVLALIVIISVMNGFQLGFIENILEISSYYVRVQCGGGQNPALVAESILPVAGVTAAIPFREIQGLIRSRDGQSGVVIRGLPANALELDPALGKHLVFEEGAFALGGDSSILLGAELARRLRVEEGDEVSILSVGGLNAETIAGDASIEGGVFTVAGVFRTNYYEYDLGWAFVNFERAGTFLSGGSADDAPFFVGIKLADRFKDRKAAAEIEKIVPENKVTTWRDYNRAFFGALRTEKLFMFILVGLIFIVVGLNIYQGQRRTVLERREEIGLLRAVGAGQASIRLVFVWDGFLTGFTGAASGMLLGLLLSFHIAGFFTLLEKAVNGFFRLIKIGTHFAIFSPAVFYIKEIEARVIPREVVIIFFFGLLSALLAAWFASGKVSKIKPAEVLRYE